MQMAVKVREVLALPSYSQARLLAGAGGLDNSISTVDVIEVPDAEKWMHGGEFLVTAGYAFKDCRERLVDLVRGLAARGSAALAIKTQRFLKTIPQEVLDAAEQLNFPIIDVPPHIPFVELTTPVLAQVLASQTLLLEGVTEVHKRLARVVLDGGGLAAVAGGLADALGNPVLIEDEQLRPLAWHIPDSMAASFSEQEFRRTFSSQLWNELVRDGVAGRLEKALGPVTWPDETDGGARGAITRLIAPIVIDRRIKGYVTVLGVKMPYKDMAELHLEQATIVAALELAKERAVEEAKARTQEDLMQDLLTGNFDNPEILISRAASFGWDLLRPLVAISLDIDIPDEFYLGNSESERVQIHLLKERCLRAAREAACLFDYKAIVSSRSDSIVILINLPEKEKVLRAAEVIQARVAGQAKELSVTAGVGSEIRTVSDIQRTYKESRQASRIGKLLGRGDRVFHFSDLGLYRLLFDLADKPEMQALCKETIGPLVQYDQDHGTNLCDTLEKFLGLSGNRKNTADELFIHRNTLNYRLRKIRDILGFDPQHPELRLKVMLALQARRLVGHKVPIPS